VFVCVCDLCGFAVCKDVGRASCRFCTCCPSTVAVFLQFVSECFLEKGDVLAKLGRVDESLGLIEAVNLQHKLVNAASSSLPLQRKDVYMQIIVDMAKEYAMSSEMCVHLLCTCARACVCVCSCVMCVRVQRSAACVFKRNALP
jgi:hypothetical protein